VATALIRMGNAVGMRVWCTGWTEDKMKLRLGLGAERNFVSGEELEEKSYVVFDTSGEVTWEHSVNSSRLEGGL
jgi:hypothetical protein